MAVVFRIKTELAEHRCGVAAEAMVLSLMEAPYTGRLVRSLPDTVRDRPLADRRRLYDIAFVNCFLGGVGESPSTRFQVPTSAGTARDRE